MKPWHPDGVELTRQPDGSYEATLRGELDGVPICDFCTSPHVTTDYDCDVLVRDGESQSHWSRGGYLACRNCAGLIDAGAYPQLVRRMARIWDAKHPDAPSDEMMFIPAVVGFVKYRRGPGRAYQPQEDQSP